uniref:Tryptophan synthase alpha chain n=1 Tax=Thermosporothrix sp. COM3 TaxID=2490863 RepID=A0A455SNM4_9CHLR|nr:tryptophan synthase alpha chain [Thermosporothrix sp. COM3]
MEVKDVVAEQPATRISQVFERSRRERRGVLIPYFMCGYPSAEQSEKIILAAIEGGADIIELGIPFSDPLADGATIQQAGHVALEQGMTLKGCMQIASRIAAQSDAPLVFMGYYNPILAYGLERFCRDACNSGICGLIIPDLPPEEAESLQRAAYAYGLAIIFLVPPTTPDERIAHIADIVAQGPGGFLYCVSLSGVTGSRSELPPHLREFIARVQAYTEPKNVPLAVGFGLSTPEHIAAVTGFADGAVIGSALVKLIERAEEAQQPGTIREYISRLRNAADSPVERQ